MDKQEKLTKETINSVNNNPKFTEQQKKVLIKNILDLSSIKIDDLYKYNTK